MKLAPDHYKTTLYGSREPGLTADAWVYGGSRVLEVYVQILRCDRQVVTAKIRVPVPHRRRKTRKGKERRA